jgi:phospholipid transport system substrate-binding protein
MIDRRTFLTSLAAVTSAVVALPASTVHAQATDKAAAFAKATGDKLVSVINGPGSDHDKRVALTRVIDATVDVDGVARFCLGRFWTQATPAEQKEYLSLFHAVLVTNITSKLGQYQGVSFTMGRTREQGEDVAVLTTVLRPNNPPTDVDWIIASPTANPRIIDVIAEGTSLRLTQRQDYASFLSHNGNSIPALIAAMRQQVGQNS